MKMNFPHTFTLLCLIALSTTASAGKLLVDQAELSFSGVHATTSEAQGVTVWNTSEQTLAGLQIKLTGEAADAFSIDATNGLSLKPNMSRALSVRFQPSEGQIGALSATCEISTAQGESLTQFKLYGLSAIGVEGAREPGLYPILQTVGLDIDIGWQSHHTHTKPIQMGSEITSHRFRKASPGAVHLEPIARYSPNFLLPFGYYTLNDSAPELHPIGTLGLRTKTSQEHNCIYPKLASGQTKFDPETEAFGIFTSSPSHIAYSENTLNEQLEPKHIPHATRIYPASDRNGKPLQNTYLICFEEATNGDYQDYVFLLSNVVPVED